MKIQTFFLSCLLLLVVNFGAFNPTAYSQAKDVVLAQGNPPLTQSMVDKVVDFMEWSLDINLPSEHKSKIQKSIVNVWKTKNQEEIKSTLEIVEMRDKLIQISEDDRNKLRAEIQAPMVESLRKDSDDEMSQILVSAYDAAHSSSIENSAPGGNSNQKSNVSNSLVGEWGGFVVSGKANYYNPGTDEAMSASGNGKSYEFFSDGRYIYAEITKTGANSCVLTTFTYVKGNYQVQGSTLTFTPTSGTVEQKNGCNSSSSVKKPATFKNKEWSETFRFKRENNRESLCLTGEYGEHCYDLNW